MREPKLSKFRDPERKRGGDWAAAAFAVADAKIVEPLITLVTNTSAVSSVPLAVPVVIVAVFTIVVSTTPEARVTDVDSKVPPDPVNGDEVEELAEDQY